VISRRRSSLGTSAVQSSDKLLRHAPGGGGANSGGNSGSSEATSCDLETHDADITIIASAGPPSSASARLSKVSSRQLCTEAMLKVLQQEIRKGRRRSAELAACADLVTRELIGRGGFGCVYKGTWHTIPAAIKVRGATPRTSLGRMSGAPLPVNPRRASPLYAFYPHRCTHGWADSWILRRLPAFPDHELPEDQQRGCVRCDGDGGSVQRAAPQHRPGLLLPHRHGGR
jgi:hypothetical protein